MKRIFLSLLFVCASMSVGHARRGRTESLPVPTVTPAIEKIADRYRDVDMLVKKAQRDAEQVHRAAQRDKQEIEGRMRRRQSRLERRRQEALRREAEQRAVLEQKTRAQSQEVDAEAEQRAQEIIKKAEKKALELREVLVAQDRKDRLNGRPKITKDWVGEVTGEFASDTSFIRRVIMEGEASRIERQNFIALFDEQRQWFDKKVSEVVFFFDEPYNAVMTKKNALSGLVDAQRQADEVVHDLVDQHHLSDEVKAQLRLLAMYEINNHLQSQPEGEVFVSADIIRQLVDKVSRSVAPGQREITVVTEKQRISELEQRIAELEQQVTMVSEPVVSPMSMVPQEEADAKVLQVTQEAAQRVAELELVLAKGMTSSGAIEPRKAEKMMARAQGQIESVLAAKEDEVANITKDLQAQMLKLQDQRVKAEEVLRTESQNKMVAVREQLADLRTEKITAQTRMSEHQAALAAERLKVHQLTTQLSAAHDHAQALKQDRDVLVSKFSHKQQEKVALESHLAQVQEHLELLTTKSHEQLVGLANQVAKRAINEEQLEMIMEKKAQERAELEIAVAQANEQLAYLRNASQQALEAMASQVGVQEERCVALENKLAGQQREGAALAQTLVQLEQAAVTTQSQHETEQAALSERVVHLQHALAALRSEQKAGRAQEVGMMNRARALIGQAKQEVSTLAGSLLRQQCRLDQRCNAYAQMQDIQDNLHVMRDTRGNDVTRDADQMQALAQVAAFGDKVSDDYDNVTQAARDAALVQAHLERIDQQVGSTPDELPAGVMNDLDVLLSLLGHTSQNVATVPAASSDEVLRAAPWDRGFFNETPEHEEEEAAHEPDEEPEMPEPVEEEEGEIDEVMMNRLLDDNDDMDDIFGSSEDDLAEDEVPESETPFEQEVVAPTANTQDLTDEDDESEEDDDDEQDEQVEEDGHAYESDEYEG